MNRHKLFRFGPVLLLAIAVVVLNSRLIAQAGISPIGPTFPIREVNGIFWAVADYNECADEFLVLMVDVTDVNGWRLKCRRIDADTGSRLGSEFHISPDPANIGAVIGVTAYNPNRGEILVVYQAAQATVNGGKNDVFGQRIDCSGNKVGGHIELVREDDHQAQADVAYDPTRSQYLVVWRFNYGTNLDKWMEGRFFDDFGSPVGSTFLISDPGIVDGIFNPKVAYNPVASEFMVVWQDGRNYPGSGPDGGYADIYGQRVDAITRTKIGSNIAIHSPINNPPYVSDGDDAPHSIVASTQDSHYAIGIDKMPWTTKGMVIEADGSLIGNVFNLGYPDFSYQTVALYNPVKNTYYMSYENSVGGNNVGGKEISASGVPITPEEIIMYGPTRDNYLAMRPSDGRYMQIIVIDGNGKVYGQFFSTDPDTTPPDPVTDLTATPGALVNTLNWTNPSTIDYTGCMIRYRTDGVYPVDVTDGDPVGDKVGVPGVNDSFVHEGLDSRITYYYSAFAHDGAPNYATGVTISVSPWALGDFEPDGDVDQEDFGRLQVCFGGDGVLPGPGCEDKDFDGDLDVDLDDFAIFQGCMGGPGGVPGC
ncbi:MAG: hypothetical protein ACYTF1_16960 [Planctomycetota bacterium]